MEYDQLITTYLKLIMDKYVNKLCYGCQYKDICMSIRKYICHNQFNIIVNQKEPYIKSTLNY